MSSDPYAVANLLQQPTESWEQYLARMGVLYRAAPPVESSGRSASRPQVRRDRSALLACLSADRWTTAAEVAALVGMQPGAARQALYLARARGAPIESCLGHGWRLVKSEVAA